MLTNVDAIDLILHACAHVARAFKNSTTCIRGKFGTKRTKHQSIFDNRFVFVLHLRVDHPPYFFLVIFLIFFISNKHYSFISFHFISFHAIPFHFDFISFQFHFHFHVQFHFISMSFQVHFHFISFHFISISFQCHFNFILIFMFIFLFYFISISF